MPDSWRESGKYPQEQLEGIPCESRETVTDQGTLTSDTLFEKGPPMDYGRGAWVYLSAAVALETIIWGYATSFGVLLDFYSNKESSSIAEDPSAGTLLPLVGTVNSGIMALLAPFLSGIIARYPSSRRALMITGLVTCFLSLFLSSYSQTCMHVFWSQGVGYGVGGSTLYYPALSYLTDWFDSRLGLANGLIFAGTGLGGLLFPLIINALLRKVGVKWTLQILAWIMTVLMGICLTLIRPRLPENSDTTDAQLNESKKELSGYSERTPGKNLLEKLGSHVRWPIAIYLVSNTLQAIGFFLPGLYLPSYAHSLSLSSSTGTATVVTLNAGAILARVVGGFLSDHYSPHLIGLTTSLMGGGSVLLIWGGFGNRGWVPLMIFATVFGCTSSAWTSLYFGIARIWLRSPHLTMPLYGAMSMTRGIGNLIAAPLSTTLMSSTKTVNEIRTGFDVASYSGVIWLSGLSLVGTFFLELIMWILQTYLAKRKNRSSKLIYASP